MVVGIQHRLVVHRRMDGGNGAAVDAHRRVQGLDHGHDGIGGAGGGGYDAMVGLQDPVIDAIDHRGINIRCRRLGKQHLARPLPQVQFSGGAVGKRAGALQHHIYAQLAPGQVLDPGTPQQADGFAVDPEPAFIAFQGTVEAPVGGVIAGQVQYGAGISQLVHRHHLQFGSQAALAQGPQDAATDPAVAVYRQSQQSRLLAGYLLRNLSGNKRGPLQDLLDDGDHVVHGKAEVVHQLAGRG